MGFIHEIMVTAVGIPVYLLAMGKGFEVVWQYIGILDDVSIGLNNLSQKFLSTWNLRM
jgi:hypothetical protein